MINTSHYVSPEVIMADLTRVFKKKEIDIYDIVEWCAHVETRTIGDVATMAFLEKVPLTVSNKMTLIPCNVARLLDVYDENDEFLTHNHSETGAFLTSIKYRNGNEFTDDTLYINYVGTPVDTETGYPLIAKGHEQACGYYCRLRLFEEDALNGIISPQMYGLWERKLAGLITNARQNTYRFRTRNDVRNMEVIRGNALPRIGSLVLTQDLYTDHETKSNP